MTEKQFFKQLAETLQEELDVKDATNQKFFSRLLKLLQQNIGDLRDADADQRTALLKRIFVNAGYNKYWQQLRSQFDKLLDSQNKLWSDNTTAQKSLARGNTRLLAFEKVEFTRFGNLGDSAVKELKKQFDAAFKENWSRKRLIEAITPINQKTEAYGSAIADTALRGWDRTVTATKAEIAGIEEAIYAGPPPIETSHDFCIENYLLTFTRDEILSMSNGVLDPVIIYMAGYGCRHYWRWLVREVLK